MENINKHIEDKIQIDERKILVPAKIKNIAVQNDHNSEVAKIVIPRYFEDRDLSAYSIMLKAVSRGGRSEVLFKETEIEVLEEEIELTWILKVPITSFSGIVKIQISVFGEDFKWQTQIAEVNIIKALDDTPIIPDQLDFIENFVVTTENKVKEMEECVDEIKKDIIYIEGKIEEAEHNASQSGSNLEQTTVIMQQVQGYKKEVENMKSQIEQIQDEVNEVKDSFEQLAEVKKQEITAEGTKQIELVANIGEECVALTQAEVVKAQEQVNIAKGHASTAKQQAIIASDKAKEATQQATISKEQAEIAKSQVALTTEQANIAKSQVALATEQANIAKAQATEATKQVGLAKQEVTKATDKANTATQQATKAQQQADIAVQKVEEINEKVLEITSLVEEAQGSVSTATTQVEEIKKQVELAKQQVQLVNDKTEEVKGEVEKAKGHANIASQQASIATEKAETATQKALEATNQVPLATEQANIAKQKATEATNQATEAKKQVDLAKAQVTLATEQAVIATEQTSQAVEQVELAKQEVAKVSEAIGRLDAKDSEQDDRLTQLENKPNSNVLLGDDEQDKFNFVKNEVIQDGLVVNAYRQDAKSIDTGITDTKWTVIFEGASDDFVTMSGDNLWYVICQKRNICITSNRISIPNGEESYININNNEVGVEVGKKITMVVTRDGNSGNITINNKNTIFEYTNNDNKKLFVGHHSRGDYNNDGKAKGWFRTLVYNRPLSPQEIEHNLSVLNNNTDSIKSLEVTKDDTTTSYNFTATENHVEMSTGRTLHDEYMGILKGFSKEFESVDGSDITVENGLEARMISGEISGRTVKNLLKEFSKASSQDDTINGKYVTPLHKPSSDNITIIAKITNIDTSSGDLLSPAFLVNTGAEYKAVYFDGGTDIKPKIKNEIFINTISVSKDAQYMDDSTKVYKPPTSTANCKIEWLVVLDGDLKVVNSNIPFGLHSTQGIITNNGQVYKIYDPIIKGETKLVDGELISLTPNDPSLEKLLSIKNTSDEINTVTKTMTKIIAEKTFDGSENWIWFSGDNDRNIGYVTLDLGQIAPNNNNIVLTLNNIFNDVMGIVGHGRAETGLCLTEGRHLRIMYKKGDERFNTLETFKQYISSNNLKINYVVNEPIVKNLTQTEIDAYVNYIKIINLPFEEDKLTLKENGDVTYTKYSDIKTFDGHENWATSLPSSEHNKSIVRFLLTNPYFKCDPSKMLSPNLPTVTGVVSYDTSVGIWGIKDDKLYIYVKKQTIGADDTENDSNTLLRKFKEWLYVNNIEILSQLLTPITFEIPKELVQPIATYGKNEISVGGSVKPTNYKLTLPVDRLSDFEKRLQALESTTVDVILNK